MQCHATRENMRTPDIRIEREKNEKTTQGRKQREIYMVYSHNVQSTFHFYFLAHLLSSPLFSLRPSRCSDPGSHTYEHEQQALLPPPQYGSGTLHFYGERTCVLSSDELEIQFGAWCLSSARRFVFMVTCNAFFPGRLALDCACPRQPLSAGDCFFLTSADKFKISSRRDSNSMINADSIRGYHSRVLTRPRGRPAYCSLLASMGHLTVCHLPNYAELKNI